MNTTRCTCGNVVTVLLDTRGKCYDADRDGSPHVCRPVERRVPRHPELRALYEEARREERGEAVRRVTESVQCEECGTVTSKPARKGVPRRFCNDACRWRFNNRKRPVELDLFAVA